MAITYEHPDIDAAARRVCNNLYLSHDLAGDLAQEVRLKMWEVEGTDKAPHDFGWVKTALYHQGVSLLRKNKRYVSFEDFSYTPDGEAPAADAYVLAQERADAVLIALSDLSEKHRAAVTLTKMDGNTVKETAHVLDIPEGTVNTRVHYALRKLEVDSTLSTLIA